MGFIRDNFIWALCKLHPWRFGGVVEKMKVVWFVPPSEQGFPNIGQYRFYKRMPIRISIIYPYLSASGCTILKDYGIDVSFIDCPTMGKKWEDVEPTIIASDFVIMEGRTPEIQQVWKWCSKIREYSDEIKIILYGDHVTWFPNESLKYCDYIVVGGDYDVNIPQLLYRLKQNIGMPGAASIFNLGLVPNLDKLPFVDRDLVDHKLYYESWRNRKTFLWIMSSRGCYYNCSYCAWVGTLWNNKYRTRSPSNVANEYYELYCKYGNYEILDDADLFDTKWGVKFAEALISMGFTNEIIWAFQTHPNMITNIDDLKLMRKSGLRTVKLGIESGNDETLIFINKGTNVKQSEKAIQLLKEAGIVVHANIMVGFPNEDKEKAYKTIDWIKKLDPNQAQFSLLIPYPTTKLFDWAKENNKLLVKEGDWNNFDASYPMLRMEKMSGEEIVQLYKDCWSKFYFDPKYIFNHVKSVRHLSGIKQLYNGFRSVRFGHMKAIGNKRKGGS